MINKCKITFLEGLTGSGKTYRSIEKCINFFNNNNSNECCIMSCYSLQALIDSLEMFSDGTGIEYEELRGNLNSSILVFNRDFPITEIDYGKNIKVIFTTHSCILKSGDSPIFNEFMTYILYLSFKMNIHLIIDESLHFFNGLEWYFKLYNSGDEGEKVPITYSYKLNDYHVYKFFGEVLKSDEEYSFYDFIHYIIDIKPDNSIKIGNSIYKTYTNTKMNSYSIFKKTKNPIIDNYCIDKGFDLRSVSECSADMAINFFFKGSSQLVYKKKIGKIKNTSYISGMSIYVLKTYIKLFKSIDFVSSHYPIWVYDIFENLNILYHYTMLKSRPVIDKGNIFLLNNEISAKFIKNISELKKINSVLFCQNKQDLKFLVKKLRTMRCTKFQFFLEGIQTTSQVSNLYSKLEEPKKAPLWISYLSSRESKGVNIANIHIIIVKVRLFIPIFFIPKNNWTSESLRNYIWNKSFQEVFESASRALRNYFDDPKKIIIFSSVRNDPEFINKISKHNKFKNFSINKLNYALGYKKNMLFFFDYINNYHFGNQMNYISFQEYKNFIPVAAKSIKKSIPIEESASYLDFLNKSLVKTQKFHLSKIYNFTLYSISIINNGICIHWYNLNIIKYIFFGCNYSFFKKFVYFKKDISILIGFNNKNYDDIILSKLLFIFDNNLKFNLNNIMNMVYKKIKLYKNRLIYLSYDLSGLFKGGFRFNPFRFHSIYSLNQISLYNNFSICTKGSLLSNLIRLLLINSIFNKSQNSFEQKLILMEKFKSYHTFLFNSKKILAFFFKRSDRLARIFFNILCSSKKYIIKPFKKVIPIDLTMVYNNFSSDSGECITRVIHFLKSKKLVSIKNSLHYKKNNIYIKLNKKIIIKNFYFFLKSGGLVINGGSIFLKSNDNNFIGYFDFESFYPSILVNFDILPKFVNKFYNYILNLRLKAKIKSETLISNSLKLLINSFSGSLAMRGNSFKLKNIVWYHKMISFGQLYLLKFIDFVINKDCSVLGGKTDGIYVLSKSQNQLNCILNKWNSFNSVIKIHLTNIKLISIYNNRYLHLDYKNNLKIDGISNFDTSIFQYNHNRLLPYCISIILKNFFINGNYNLNYKLIKEEDMINWVFQTKNFNRFLFFGNRIIKFIRWVPIKKEFLGKPLFKINKSGRKELIHPNVLILNKLKIVKFNIIDIDYYLLLIKKNYNIDLFKSQNYNFESKLYKIYTKKKSKIILNLLINKFELGYLKMPKWKKSRRSILFFFTFKKYNDCKISISWNRGGTLYLNFFSVINYTDLDYLSILELKFQNFKIL